MRDMSKSPAGGVPQTGSLSDTDATLGAFHPLAGSSGPATEVATFVGFDVLAAEPPKVAGPLHRLRCANSCPEMHHSGHSKMPPQIA